MLEAIILIFITVLGITAVMAGVIAVGAIINGWILSIIWGWFMVPIFHLPALSIPAAIGFVAVIGFVFHKPDLASEKEAEKKTITQNCVMVFNLMIVRPALTLLFCYIVKHYL